MPSSYQIATHCRRFRSAQAISDAIGVGAQVGSLLGWPNPSFRSCNPAGISPALSFQLLIDASIGPGCRGATSPADTRATDCAHFGSVLLADTIRANFPTLRVTKDGAARLRPRVSAMAKGEGALIRPRSGRGGRRFKSCHSDQIKSKT
jgi:hypothetical protein